MTDPLWLLTNRSSGSNTDAAVDAVVAALTEAGRPPSRVVDAQDGLPERGELERAGVTTLVVFTGDGTVNAAATSLEGWGGNVLVLPGGTANLLARALHGEQSAEEIAARIATLRPVQRHCIRTAHGTALIEVLAGPGAMWSDVREGLREKAVGDVAAKTVDAIRQSTVGPMVAMIDPPVGKPEGYAGLRLAPDGPDGMLVEGYGAETVGDYLKQGLALLRRNFRDGPHEELGAHPQLVCRSLDDAPIPLMIDGERRDGGAQERFTLAPFRLDLLGSTG